MPSTRSTEQPVDSAVLAPAVAPAVDPSTRAPRRARRTSAATTTAAGGKPGKTSRTSGKTGGRTGTAKAAAPAPPTEPAPPAPPAPPTPPAPPQNPPSDEQGERGIAVAYPDAVRRQQASAAGRRPSGGSRSRPGPVQVSNVLDGLPEPLRRLAVRTGDTRKVAKVTTPSGALAIEMDIATARSLSLVP